MKAIDFFDVDELIHASFRYYLGRRTIATCAFAKDLASAWDHIGKNTRMMIAEELLRAYKGWRPLGHDCDREMWDLVKEKAMKNPTDD